MLTEADELDEYVYGIFEELGLKPKLTRASGQVRGDGDVTAPPFMAENKYRSTEGFGLSRKDFLKARNQARKQSLRELFFRRNVHKETVVSMHVETLMWLVRSQKE